MLKNTFIIFTTLLMLSLADRVVAQGGAQQMLREGSRIQAADDTTDRAADVYQQLIRTHPRSAKDFSFDQVVPLLTNWARSNCHAK